MLTSMHDKLIEAAKAFLASQGLSGWSQTTNAKFFLGVLVKLQSQKAKPDILLGVMQVASNASAFRQRLESAGVVKKGVKAAPADLLANLEL